VRFRNAVTRDVAYGGLTYRHRRELHAEAARSILTSVGEDAAAVAEVLSFHFHHADRHAEAWTHSVVAAEQAQAAHANAEAVVFLERAIDAGRRCGVDAAALAAAHESLAVVRTRLGLYAAADRAYRAARRHLGADPVVDARLMLRIAWLQGYLERYANARRWVTRALRRLDGVAGAAAAGQRAQLLACQARFAQEAGRISAAMRWCRRTIEATAGATSEAALAMACEAGAEAQKILGWGHLYTGRLDEATPHLARALALYEAVDDLSGQASVLNMMGASAYWRGEWPEALGLYERARELVGRTGNAVMQAFCTNNIGEILCDQGRLDDAERLFRQAVRGWQAAGHRSRVAYAKTNLARVALRADRYADALALYEEAKAESLDVGADGDVLESDARIAECLLAQGLWAQALALAETGLDHARSLGDSPPQSALLHRVRGAALLYLGDLGGARASLEASLDAGRVRHADYEVALTLQVMADLSERENGERDIDLDAESRVILDRLGVV
jgi:tetratricopeptide (TPR) repeat protein